MERRVLIAGIGNIFLGDDGFGVEVARRLAAHRLPPGVEVRDFGIRGMDLVYALLDDWQGVIFADAAQRGNAPGTLYVIEPRVEEGQVTLDTHGMDPAKVLSLARALGAPAVRTYVVACEPERVLSGDRDPEVVVELTAPVQAAVEEAVRLVEGLVREIRAAFDEAETGGARAIG